MVGEAGENLPRQNSVNHSSEVELSPLNLDLPADNQLQDNRVYRLPPVQGNHSHFENLRVTVTFPENVPSITSNFNRLDPHRVNRPSRPHYNRSKRAHDEDG